MDFRIIFLSVLTLTIVSSIIIYKNGVNILYVYERNSGHKKLVWKKIVVIGDSNVQFGYSNKTMWLSMLAFGVQRYADVLNRGFDGYNSRYIRLILPKLMSEFQNRVEYICSVVLLFGTNDACTSEPLHIPLYKFVENYQWIIDYLIKMGVERNSIIIVTPPRIVDEEWTKARHINESDYKDVNVKQYAEKCKELAKKNEVGLIDIYGKMEYQVKDYEKFFHDGLHLSVTGSKFLVDELYSEVWNRYMKKNIIKHNFPAWTDIDYKKDLKTLPQ